MKYELKSKITEILNKNPNISTEEINRIIQITVDKYNNTGIEDFDGLSPKVMYDLLYSNLGENIISVNPHGFDGNDIPIIRQIRYFLNLIDKNNGIKLTKAGNLPPVIVKEIYQKNYISDRMIESGITKLTKETDADCIVAMKIFCKLAGLIRKRDNKISLTKNAIKEVNSDQFFEKIFKICYRDFNWAYFDGFENKMIGQFGNNYTLYLLNRYGNEWKSVTFYADLYLKAFPDIFQENDIFGFQLCFIKRTFNQINEYFGFIEYDDNKFGMGKIKTTDIFRKYIKIGMYVA